MAKNDRGRVAVNVKSELKYIGHSDMQLLLTLGVRAVLLTISTDRNAGC